MKIGEIYKSEGGYRVAFNVYNGGPVITGRGTHWFETKKQAKIAWNAYKTEMNQLRASILNQ